MRATIEGLQKFTDETVADMTEDEKANWDSLSDFERKTIAASAYFFMIEQARAK